jgi:hypothetical protein
MAARLPGRESTYSASGPPPDSIRPERIIILASSPSSSGAGDPIAAPAASARDRWLKKWTFARAGSLFASMA